MCSARKKHLSRSKQFRAKLVPIEALYIGRPPLIYMQQQRTSKIQTVAPKSTGSTKLRARLVPMEAYSVQGYLTYKKTHPPRTLP